MNKQELENYRKAGKIAQEVVKFAREIIKKGLSLLEIAEKIENKILELGGKPAFPVNLSINEIAAHYTPDSQDETKAHGLLKVDIGVHIQGAIADTAFSIDLENSEENKKLIEASEKAVSSALETAQPKIKVSEIGKVIHKTITNSGFSPIRNLSGHELGNYLIHAGLTIPNYDNSNPAELEEGAYAIEPFSTTGEGIVRDGASSGIFRLEGRKAIRDSLARQIIDFIEDEYKTLPFCSRWIVKKFGARSLLSLKLMEQAGIILQYPQLVEKSSHPVAQAEHTIIITDKVEITTN